MMPMNDQTRAKIFAETPRLILREIVMEDAEGMLELDSDIKIRIAQISEFHIFLFIVEYYFSKSKTRFPFYFLELLYDCLAFTAGEKAKTVVGNNQVNRRKVSNFG